MSVCGGYISACVHVHMKCIFSSLNVLSAMGGAVPGTEKISRTVRPHERAGQLEAQQGSRNLGTSLSLALFCGIMWPYRPSVSATRALCFVVCCACVCDCLHLRRVARSSPPSRSHGRDGSVRRATCPRSVSRCWTSSTLSGTESPSTGTYAQSHPHCGALLRPFSPPECALPGTIPGTEDVQGEVQKRERPGALEGEPAARHVGLHTAHEEEAGPPQVRTVCGCNIRKHRFADLPGLRC